MRVKFSLVFLLSVVIVSAQEVNIIPQPFDLKLADPKDQFFITRQTKFVQGRGNAQARHAPLCQAAGQLV